MNGKDLSRQLNGLPEDMIAEAMAPADEPGRKHPLQRRWVRVAAIAAALAILFTALTFWPSGGENYVTAPGFFVVRAYDFANEDGAPSEAVVLEEGVTFSPTFQFNPAMSIVQHVAFDFSLDSSQYEDENIALEVSTNAGIFEKDNADIDFHELANKTPTEQHLMSFYGQHFQVGMDKRLYWNPWGFDYDYMKSQYDNGEKVFDRTYRPLIMTNEPAYIDLIFRANGQIIGFCVIEICVDGTFLSEQVYHFELLTMVSYPKIDGRWQNISEKYVQEEINRIHTEQGC